MPSSSPSPLPAPNAVAAGEPPISEPLIWRIALGGQQAMAAHRARLAPDELARAARFGRAEDADRFVAARGALRQVLGRALGRPPATLSFAEGPFGKPRLAPPDDQSGLRFNVAHSGRVALVAVARGAEVGVDVEQIRSGVEAERLAGRLFTAAERAQVAALPPGAAYNAFFALWAAKEAVIKALGRGLFARLDGFDIRLDTDGRLVPQPIVVREAHGGVRETAAASLWWLAPIEAGEGYRAAVAVAGAACRIDVADLLVAH